METADAIQFIEEQLKVYRGKIKSAEIVEIQDQLNELLVDSTEKHPRVKKLRDELNAKQDELERDNLEFTENAMLDSGTTKPIIQEIRRALDNVDGGTAAIGGDGQKKGGNLDRDTYKPPPYRQTRQCHGS